MKRNKFLIVFLIISVICIFCLPSVLFANDEYYWGFKVNKTAYGFDSGEFEFEFEAYSFDPADREKTSQHLTSGSFTIGYEGGSNGFGSFTPIPNNLKVAVVIKETGTNGATGVKNSLGPPPTATNGIFDTVITLYLSSEHQGDSVYFDNLKGVRPEPKPGSEPGVWVRDYDMTCYQVWVNEDNNFEFIFWWVYGNNNWVQIFDMEDNLVWETDFLKDKPRFEVDLPDGMYKVQTFHEAGKILQEFYIGKPGPEM